jgi:hypothetical protein
LNHVINYKLKAGLRAQPFVNPHPLPHREGVGGGLKAYNWLSNITRLKLNTLKSSQQYNKIIFQNKL